ncbi:alpha-(1,3)-fucosyltransferase 10 [Triplophysa dalaica]|uniref:alpha-(1,3)-fucosyltransferase 10 n=1 Tax=Triplophysa dalaica TaxID=1582913 RepID=UPI0024E02B16|nr:alpha-(1,3)-fucosyltransferase 10 [Triplophysa dalaica]
MMRISVRKLCAVCLCACACASLFLYISIFQVGQTADTQLIGKRTPKASDVQDPVIVWWSPVSGEQGRVADCGRNRCVFTTNRSHHSHPQTRAFLFYGTDFSAESLPLPRSDEHHWALFHEESPKNNYKLFHPPLITLFNHTATFSRHSHLPLTTQHLESLSALTSPTHLLPLSLKNQRRKTLAPVAYVQSDCDPPSDRDVYVQELMRHIQVDSYGACLHNKDLPSHLRDSAAMEHEDLYHLLSQYKFLLAFENAVCEDYITEKLWRPLKMGVVPVYYGAPNVGMWLPDDRSAVVVNPDQPPEELARYLKRLDTHDEEYSQYLQWKHKRRISNVNLVKRLRERQWSVHDVTQENVIDAFECLVCNRVWENIHRHKQKLAAKVWRAEETHLMCPPPKLFHFPASPPNGSYLRSIWRASYDQSKKEAGALRRLIERNTNFTDTHFWSEVFIM